MYFLVDFENVHNAGLEGLEFLTHDDSVIIYFSETCKAIKRYRVDQIIKSGCRWKIVGLKRTGKNALDYYIATSVGEIMALNPKESIAIISNDKGFRAVKDYWKERLDFDDQLVQSGTILLGMCNGHDNTGRRKLIQKGNETLSLEIEYAKYQERSQFTERLEESFIGSAYECRIPEIKAIINNETTPKAKYLASLKAFGRKDGMDIYRRIRLITISCNVALNKAS